MVARDGPIRAANQDSAAARRARIGRGRSESIEPSTRGLPQFGARHGEQGCAPTECHLRRTSQGAAFEPHPPEQRQEPRILAD